MRYLFIDTSFGYVVSLIENDKIVCINKSEENFNTSDKILPVISSMFDNVDFKINDINKIFIVTGPGSFTGIRVGVTIAKILGYTLNIPLIKLSKLELLATTSVKTKYVMPVIDARRGYAYVALYDNDLNIYLDDCYEVLDTVTKKYNDYTIVSDNSNLDIIKIIKKHELDEVENPHLLKPNYLKKTEAEEKLDRKNN